MDKDKIIGTISATCILNADKTADVYVYDEVVDYFTLLSGVHEGALYLNMIALNNTNTNDTNTIQQIKSAIALLTDPYREKLLAELFTAAQIKIQFFLAQHGIHMNNTRCFIRAAAGREAMYQRLGCQANVGVQVIHGAPSDFMKALDKLGKAWAADQLTRLPKVSSSALQTPPANITGAVQSNNNNNNNNNDNRTFLAKQ